jgi:hypothetical protein
MNWTARKRGRRFVTLLWQYSRSALDDAQTQNGAVGLSRTAPSLEGSRGFAFMSAKPPDQASFSLTSAATFAGTSS